MSNESESSLFLRIMDCERGPVLGILLVIGYRTSRLDFHSFGLKVNLIFSCVQCHLWSDIESDIALLTCVKH